jgi:hypothetical protein
VDQAVHSGLRPWPFTNPSPSSRILSPFAEE